MINESTDTDSYWKNFLAALKEFIFKERSCELDVETHAELDAPKAKEHTDASV